MREFYCKIITAEFTPAAQQQVMEFVREAVSRNGGRDIRFEPLVSYWKDTKMGELSFRFSSEKPLSEIQFLFADRWQEDTADVRWSNILCPSTTFIWLSQ